jgi:hypothetical protein
VSPAQPACAARANAHSTMRRGWSAFLVGLVAFFGMAAAPPLFSDIYSQIDPEMLVSFRESAIGRSP